MSNKLKRQDLKWPTAPLEDLGAVGTQFAQGIARYQSEWLNLFNRRASAYHQIPERLSHCKTPVDLWREQMSFLTTMQRHYFEAARHSMAAAVQESAVMEYEKGGSQATTENLPRSATPGPEDRPETIEPRAA